MPLCRSIACGCSIQSNTLNITGSGTGPDPWIVDQTVTPADIAAINATLATIQAFTTPGAWTALTLQNSWGNFGSGYQVMQSRKVGDRVELRGEIFHSSGSGTVAFTLPAGQRPPATVEFACKAGPGTGYFNINSAGAALFTVQSGGATSPAVGVLAAFSTVA